jgi:tRNA A-37 threonylcarbamoyl transferase component Bud32
VHDELSRDDLVRGLVARGVIPAGVEVDIEPMKGGVSADVFMLSFGDDHLVVKMALSRLRVTQEWRSSPTRVLREADAMVFARTIRPDNVPEIVDVDEERLVITMRAAPPTMKNWRPLLLAGAVDPDIGRLLGAALADWHSESSAQPAALERFGDRSHFFDLRISPFFLRVAEVHRDLEPIIAEVVVKLTGRSVCLVHGDFSPKNVLVGDRSPWVLDWETAHTGDPTFDVAFLVSHLVCKAVHRPGDADRYRACADAFVAAYLEASALAIEPADLVRQVGCLVLARVDGKSPVDYFSPPEQEAARALGRRVILEGRSDVAGLWPVRVAD